MIGNQLKKILLLGRPHIGRQMHFFKTLLEKSVCNTYTANRITLVPALTASLVEPWFVFLPKLLEPKYLGRDQTSIGKLNIDGIKVHLTPQKNFAKTNPLTV